MSVKYEDVSAYHQPYPLKGQFTCRPSAFYPSRLFWCELSSFRDISLISNKIELHGIQPEFFTFISFDEMIYSYTSTVK